MGLLATVADVIDGKQPVSVRITTPEFTFAMGPDGAAPVKTATESRKPVIGISGSSEESKSVIAAMTQVRSAGGVPVYIGHFAERAQKHGSIPKSVAIDLSRIDGLMVLGNDGDIDPAKYGAQKDSHTNVETDLKRAAYEETAIKQAMDIGMPVFGICGGMQRINVLGGGTLHQHVPDIVGDNHHMQSENHIPNFVPVQAVKIVDGTMLSDIAGSTRSVYTPTHQQLPPGVVMENSFHHQAVKDVRPDFQVNAVSSDGIIEGIEPKLDGKYGKQFIAGIQWHPEFGASELGPKLASNFIGAAKTYAKDKPQSASFEQLSESVNNYYDVHTNVPASPPLPELMLLDPAVIKTDPASYQFRSNCDEKGVTHERRLAAEHWDPILNSEPLIVHQRKNGEYFVVDGHHRLDLAMRTKADGKGPGNIPVQVLKESDGYTVNDVKIIAAYKNLQRTLNKDNSTTTELLDGARVMKQAQTTEHPNWLPTLKMDTGDLHVSYKLSQMSDTTLDAVKKGKIQPRTAAFIADGLPDKAAQDEAVMKIAGGNFQKQFGSGTQEKQYNIAVKFNGATVHTGSFTIPSVSVEQPVSVQLESPQPQPQQPAMPPSHVERLMAQRNAATSAVAR